MVLIHILLNTTIGYKTNKAATLHCGAFQIVILCGNTGVQRFWSHCHVEECDFLSQNWLQEKRCVFQQQTKLSGVRCITYTTTATKEQQF